MVESRMKNPDKEALRRTMLQRRQSISASDRLEAARAIAHHYADHPFLTYAASFAGYYAIRGELDVLAIFNRMATFNKLSALPCIREDGLLDFRLWKPGEKLEDGPLGTKHPPETSAIIIPEVILTPLLAVDETGHRLGYGGGYYDRTIRHLRTTMEKPPLYIGVAFMRQELPTLPVHDDDERLDGILTEQGVSMFV